MNRAIILVFGAMIAATAFGADVPPDQSIPIAFSRTLHSAVLNEDRRVIVSLPAGYGQSNKAYPVLYLLDGEDGPTVRAAGLVRYLASYQIPELIVVGVPNVDRGRDLSVVPLEQLPTSSAEGTARFLRFLTEELLPDVDRRYRTLPRRILAGNSAAGQYVLYAMVSAPEAFDAFLTGAPSLGTGGDFLLDRLTAFFAGRKSFPKYVSMVSYDRDNLTTTDYVPRLVRVFEQHRPDGFRWLVKTVPGTAHVPPSALLDGLVDCFAGWKTPDPPTFSLDGGKIPPESAAEVAISAVGGEIRYTLDGTEPGRQSTLYRGAFPVKGPITVKARCFLDWGESRTAEAEFETAPLRPAIASGATQPGLAYRYFERVWFILPDRIEIPPVKTGVTPLVSLSPRRREAGFLLEFSGVVEIPTDGVQLFFLTSSGISKLFLDEEFLIEHPGRLADLERGWAIGLKAGKHALRVLYSNYWLPGQSLKLSYAGPGRAKAEVPAAALSHFPNPQDRP